MKSLEKKLQVSLAIGLVLILFGLLLIANISTRNLLEKFVVTRLEHDAVRILDSLLITPDVSKVRWRQLNPIYNTPNSGHYYAIKLNSKQPNETILKSPSLSDSDLPFYDAINSIISHWVPGPEGQYLVLLSQIYTKNGQQVIISIAEDMNLLLLQRRNFNILFISIGIFGFLLMLILQRFVIRQLFKHLDYSRHEITQIESGDLKQLSEEVPTEIYPLVREFNRSLALMQQRMERSRNALGNLAHALKTPLNLLMQQLDSDITKLDKDHTQQALTQAKSQAKRIGQLTERELKRARMAGLGNTTQRFDPRKELPILIEVLKQAHHKNDIEVKLHIGDSVKVFGDREDMLELLGNLLDNACKWAKSKVICTISMTRNNRENTTSTDIIIEDDGAGKEPVELIELTKRGIRLDETVEGHGLGLAISKDIVKLYGGTIHFDRSEKLGGFLVEIKLP